MARSTSPSVATSGTAHHAVPGRSLARYVFLSLRPAQWSKNPLVFAGLTIPFPLYGIFRYLYLVHQREGGGSSLLACVALWALTVAVIIYRPI